MPDTKSASHIPLTYMIREAQRAGLNFDPEKLVEMGVTEPSDESNTNAHHDGAVPDIRVEKSSPTSQTSPCLDIQPTHRDHFNFTGDEEKKEQSEQNVRSFHRMLHKAHLARIHDSLQFASGLTKGQVITWNISMPPPYYPLLVRRSRVPRPMRCPI